MIFAAFAVVLGAAAAQNDSAGTRTPAENSPVTPAYLYAESQGVNVTEGLLAPLLNPATRSTVVMYLEEKIGDVQVTEALLEAAESHQVDPALVVSLARQESGFQARARGVNKNRTVDRGLMQLNSSTFSFLSEEEFFNPQLNADYGVSYLRHTIDLAGGNIVAALAMYNAGPGRVGSTGAPRSTLDYISNILGYRDELVRGYYQENTEGSVLMAMNIQPVKDPDSL